MCSASGCEFCFIAQHAFALTLEVEDLVEELEHVKKKAVALIASTFSRQNEMLPLVCIYTCVERHVPNYVHTLACVARIAPNVHPHSLTRRSVSNLASTAQSVSTAEKKSGRSKVV